LPQAKRGRADSRRFQALLVILVLSLTAVGVRLVWVHAVDAPAFAELALEQRLRHVELAPRRGTIFDRDGQPLAVTAEAKTVYAVPELIQDPVATADAVAGVLGGDPADYVERFGREADFVYVDRKADLAQADELEQLELPGIGFLDDYRRTYPAGDLAGGVIGFVGVDDVGLAGLEQYYDEILAGEPGNIVAERDPYGRILPGAVRVAEEPVEGTSIVLTIDKEIQYETQSALTRAVENAGAEAGWAVVMAPDTGEILAMASYPTFDPNHFGTADDAAMRNRPVTDVYEPGSTMKSFTAAAALEAGLCTPDTVYSLPSTIRVADRVIHESHPRPPVSWTLREIVAKSSNVGAVKLGQALGEDGMFRAFADLGFDRPTGVDFPGETAGYLPEVEDWSASTIGNLPFGQGMSVNALQLSRAMCALANGGTLVTPHLLRAVPGDASQQPTWPQERAMGEETSAMMRDMLASVVEEGGTGTAAAVEGFAVAGKTGTAQKARPDGLGYAEGSYISSFAGFLPAQDPEVFILVALDEPTKGIYGGAMAGPAFSEIGTFCMSHMRVTVPDGAAAEDADAGASGGPAADVAAPVTEGAGEG
jgi:cell division protein FtsI (penicillin-binding protein 3)